VSSHDSYHYRGDRANLSEPGNGLPIVQFNLQHDGSERERAAISNCISEISRLYRHRVCFKVIEAQSPLGLWKQIRHKVFKYPAFIVDGKKTYVGFDCEELGALIDQRIKEGY